MIRPTIETPAPGQESVWDFPRPAVAEITTHHLKIIHAGIIVAETRRAVRTLETSHPPSYYFPTEDVDMKLLTSSPNSSFCEWKGNANYYDVTVNGNTFSSTAWTYQNPTKPFDILRSYIAFYAAPFDLCTVDGEKVIPQPGGFYGGWVTSKLAGPFKGTPGSRFW